MRSLLLAVVLGLAQPAPVLAAPPVAAASVLAEEWSWREFRRFWSGQLGRTSGVLGTVTLVAALAVLIIMSKRR